MSAPAVKYTKVEWSKYPTFDCGLLRATLTTSACATNWRAPRVGSQCESCALGKAHALATDPAAAPRPASVGSGSCLRCGRTDMRLIGGHVCIGCYNRAREWRIGSTRRGRPPVNFIALHRRLVAIEDANGQVTYRSIEVRHVAEALGWVARHHLPPGARFSDARPGVPTWSLERERFEYIHSTGHLLLERMRASGVLEFTAAGGAPSDGWSVAVPRQPVSILTAGEAAVLLDLMADDEVVPAWTPIAHVCGGCRRSPLEGRRTDGGAWEVRCPGCGATNCDRDCNVPA